MSHRRSLRRLVVGGLGATVAFLCLAPGAALANTALNIALTPSATATASTQASGDPASNAIDGDASTDWCATQWTGSLTVDLGHVRSLSGLGLTLGQTTTTALVDLSYG